MANVLMVLSADMGSIPMVLEHESSQPIFHTRSNSKLQSNFAILQCESPHYVSLAVSITDRMIDMMTANRNG